MTLKRGTKLIFSTSNSFVLNFLLY